jgi:hypothetical protein
MKKILLVGRTGQGKSALANVLSNKESNFRESESSTSVTKGIQVIAFEYKGEEYQVIDSIGIGDTTLTQAQVLREIAQGYEIIKDGIHQVLFVNGERFTPEEVETYNVLKGFFFDENVDKYTTIVRTRFPSFKDESKCKKDIQLLLAENNNKITEMINSCNGIIHVDNPSINITGEDDEDEEDKEFREMRNNLNKKIRDKSREKLLEHLEI